ncbi:prepilin-type N-terminal cleavage/methylation domain-containing protein [Vibrio makurazakiensis]|uniref:prepilin-type N-terminal cleavage/methylation domain-containing protein n=1 Tax=Vibrio makurazakiensis TaxID=2910250 RepID=UPI003D0E9423
MNRPNRTSPINRTLQSGFTLVELIIVILLIAIVSAYASSRYIGRDDFSAFIAQEQVVSVIRQVQINRMQSNVDIDAVVGNSNFVLAITGNCVGSEVGCAEQSEARSDWTVFDGVTMAAASDTAPAIPLSEISFDLLGNPIGDAASGVIITITSNSNTCSVDINEQGYVGIGGCL